MLIDENITTRGQYEAEMARLTGTVPICIPEIPGIREWIGAEQLAALAGSPDDPISDMEQPARLVMEAALLAARAAYSKGWRSGQRLEAAEAAKESPSVGFAPPSESLAALRVLIDAEQPEFLVDSPDMRVFMAARVADARAAFAMGWKAAREPGRTLAPQERTALELMGVQIGKYEPEPEDAGTPG